MISHQPTEAAPLHFFLYFPSPSYCDFSTMWIPQYLPGIRKIPPKNGQATMSFRGLTSNCRKDLKGEIFTTAGRGQSGT